MSSIKYPDSLDKIIDLLRKKGVKSIEIEGIKLELSDEAPPSPYKQKQIESQPQEKPIVLSEEDWLLWSTNVDEVANESH